jgi:hypothetical protein
MAEIRLAPYAPALLESMRAVGYSLDSALADLIDNSISADARHIRIRFSPYGDAYVAVIDDGHGMAPDVLTKAMRHGSQDPNEVRSANDLGRFGLGLKTASLSQCSKLTVISLRDGILSARQWDLDVIAAREDWILVVPEGKELKQLPHVQELEVQGHGTIVLWQNLDRLAAGESSIERALGDSMTRVNDHLALVFHRYVRGEPGIRRVNISVNENPLADVDPFLTGIAATQPMPLERIRIGNAEVLVQPYILPHISKLRPDELKAAGGEEGLRRQQGFYVYRGRRLIVWGTWFRLARQEELSKLARVRVDIPNSLDHLWTLDIKKSAASPPEVVRENLRRIINKIGERSKRVYTYRGRKVNQDGFVHSWDRIEGREGICYRLNKEHPLFQAVDQRLEDNQRTLFRQLTETIESMFPADALYADMASDTRIVVQQEERELETNLYDLALALLDAAGSADGARERLLNNLRLLEPFARYPDITLQIIARLSDGK